MKIYYGVQGYYRDITFAYCTYNLRDFSIVIPALDYERSEKIGDHLPGVEKHILIVPDNKEPMIIPNGVGVNVLFHDEIMNNVNKRLLSKPIFLRDQNDINDLHSKLLMTYGSFQDELPEQLLAMKYIHKNDKVLEIGANIGRNSIILSCLLENEETQLVSLECNTSFVPLLQHNRYINALLFNIEPSALSTRRLAIRDWNTMALSPDEVVPEGYKEIQIMSFEQIETKYNISFDTIVIDAEGALYYILLDNPNILRNIKKIIMENDYDHIEHYNFIRDLLLDNGFIVECTQGGGWGCCTDFFYQVWIKN
jgi:FkbM family methyltransferase